MRNNHDKHEPWKTITTHKHNLGNMKTMKHNKKLQQTKKTQGNYTNHETPRKPIHTSQKNEQRQKEHGKGEELNEHREQLRET
jgi:hypothetical protein